MHDAVTNEHDDGTLPREEDDSLPKKKSEFLLLLLELSPGKVRRLQWGKRFRAKFCTMEVANNKIFVAHNVSDDSSVLNVVNINTGEETELFQGQLKIDGFFPFIWMGNDFPREVEEPVCWLLLGDRGQACAMNAKTDKIQPGTKKLPFRMPSRNNHLAWSWVISKDILVVCDDGFHHKAVVFSLPEMEQLHKIYQDWFIVGYFSGPLMRSLHEFKRFFCRFALSGAALGRWRLPPFSSKISDFTIQHPYHVLFDCGIVAESKGEFTILPFSYDPEGEVADPHHWNLPLTNGDNMSGVAPRLSKSGSSVLMWYLKTNFHGESVVDFVRMRPNM